MAGLAASADPVEHAAGSARSYSRETWINRGKNGDVHVLASIDDLEAFQRTWSAGHDLPLKNVRADGNRITGKAGKRTVTLENVLPEAFGKRLAKLNNGTGIVERLA